MFDTSIIAGHETLAIACRTLPLIGLTLFLVELLDFYGLLKIVHALFRPLVNWAPCPGNRDWPWPRPSAPPSPPTP
jgi:spore maturation protein SpmB